MFGSSAALVPWALLLVAAPLGLLSARTIGAAANSIFEFHSGFWINLHHFLYDQARQEPSRPQPDDAIGAASSDWSDSLAFYKNSLVSRDLLFDRGMVAIKNSLEDQEGASLLTPTAGLPGSLVPILEKVAPIYRGKLWAEQDRANQRWINGVSPLVDRYGDQLRSRLSTIYQTPWPSAPIRVDVTNFASWAGAYTTNYPTRITVSSLDPGNQGVAALETLFHEASHGISDKLERAIRDECRRQQRRLPRKDLWHAVIFYTSGELVRRDFPDYIPYAYKNGLWQRAWPMYVRALDRDWKPYLDGRFSFDSAVATLVKDVGEPLATSKSTSQTAPLGRRSRFVRGPEL